MDSDRRKFARIPSDQLVSFTPFAGAASLGHGGDVSLGGIRLKTAGCTLRYNDLLRVSFNVADQTVEAVGRVVWTQPLDDVTTEIGLEFIRIDPWAARLIEEEMKRAASV